MRYTEDIHKMQERFAGDIAEIYMRKEVKIWEIRGIYTEFTSEIYGGYAGDKHNIRGRYTGDKRKLFEIYGENIRELRAIYK